MDRPMPFGQPPGVIRFFMRVAMRLRQWRRWARALALAAVGALMLTSARVRADGSAEPPEEHEHVVKIGPQAVVIVNQRGVPRMYDDPAQQESACKTNIGCIGRALGVLTGLGVVAYARGSLYSYGTDRAVESVTFRE